MKKLFILFVLGLSVPAAAEIVSTVSFNPSRIGQYEHLKISKDANFKGGLETPTLKVNTGGTVAMEWEEATGEKYYKVPTVIGGVNTFVTMPNTTFWSGGIDAEPANYSAANETTPSGADVNVVINGGKLSFATDNDSYVKELTQTGSGKLQHYTTELNEKTLYITGAAGSSIDLTDEKASGLNKYTTLGFHLAGVDIPHPQGHMCEGSTCATTKPYQKLCWVQRCAKPKDSDPWQVAWVLSLVNGSCPAKKDSISCGGSTSEDSGLTWQVASSNWGSAEDHVACEECSKQLDTMTCQECCLHQGGGYLLDTKIGTSCTTEGQTYRGFDIREDTRPNEYAALPCHCSGYYITFICK